MVAGFILIRLPKQKHGIKRIIQRYLGSHVDEKHVLARIIIG
jgi:hypothetical protein